jgi:hypothetical protein
MYCDRDYQSALFFDEWRTLEQAASGFYDIEEHLM